MKQPSEQSGFITMIVIIVLILVAVIALAFMRVTAVKN
jgi:Tfp pilus assembly protein PilX